jgi:hypothetical protein
LTRSNQIAPEAVTCISAKPLDRKTPPTMNDQLTWLQDWYAAQCDGDWEHIYGVEIGTLDNPGWSIAVDLAETALESLILDKVETRRSETDWLVVEIRDQKFLGFCGSQNLGELIGIFRKCHDRYAGE